MKREISEILVETARRRATITYQQLTERLTVAQLAPNDPSLAPLLREISEAEDAAGRGLLTAVVVRRDTGRPGRGFYALASQRGRDTTSPAACWQDELQRVYRAWRQGGS